MLLQVSDTALTTIVADEGVHTIHRELQCFLSNPSGLLGGRNQVALHTDNSIVNVLGDVMWYDSKGWDQN